MRRWRLYASRSGPLWRHDRRIRRHRVVGVHGHRRRSRVARGRIDRIQRTEGSRPQGVGRVRDDGIAPRIARQRGRRDGKRHHRSVTHETDARQRTVLPAAARTARRRAAVAVTDDEVREAVVDVRRRRRCHAATDRLFVGRQRNVQASGTS